MNSITQDVRYRLSILSYTAKKGVTKAAIKYHANRQFIYRLKWRYDGTVAALKPKLKRPHYNVASGKISDTAGAAGVHSR